MREILFRGKRADNGEWVYGDLLHNICTTKIREKDKDIERIAKSYSVIPDTVGQYTGLKDKNGKRIFEGDIIKYKCGDVAKVIFTNYGAFVGLTETLSHEGLSGEVLVEVIGNIWEVEE